MLSWLAGKKKACVELLLKSSDEGRPQSLSSWGSIFNLLQLLCAASPEAVQEAARKIEALESFAINSAKHLHRIGAPGQQASSDWLLGMSQIFAAQVFLDFQELMFNLSSSNIHTFDIAYRQSMA